MTLAEAMRCSQETARALEMAARNDPFIGAMLSGIEFSTSAMPEGEVIARAVLALSKALAEAQDVLFRRECIRPPREEQLLGQLAQAREEVRALKAKVDEAAMLLAEADAAQSALTQAIREREKAEARVRELEERAACAEFERDAWIEAHGTPVQIAAFSERGRALLDQLDLAKKRAERAEECLKLHDAVFAAVRDVLGLPITFTYAEAHAAVRRLLKASKETTSENQR